ncbi:MAG: hypothetical protein K9N49_05860 [Candidatus Marinimicrobia bacterium]|nr:hypothetical protein [Candidatus Neomarinimicrobiota bacterium]
MTGGDHGIRNGAKAALLSGLLVALSLPAGQAATLRLLAADSTVFADGQKSYRIVITDPEAFRGRLLWRFAVGPGAVARSETALRVAAQAPLVTDIVLDVPPVREGVMIEGLLTLTVVDDAGRTRATLAQPLQIYPRDPVAHRNIWLQELNVQIYDPEGATRGVFDALEMPYQPLANLAALAEMKQPTVLIGEGLSLRAQRGLMDVVLQVAQQGARVIVLAPVDGAFCLPETPDGTPPSARLLFQDRTMIRELGKHFEAAHWADGADNVSSTFRLSGNRGLAELLVNDGWGWPWVEVRFAGGGTILLSGFALIEQWESSPTPRYLLVRMLEYITKPKETVK